jgi:hypothetical protein
MQPQVLDVLNDIAHLLSEQPLLRTKDYVVFGPLKSAYTFQGIEYDVGACMYVADLYTDEDCDEAQAILVEQLRQANDRLSIMRREVRRGGGDDVLLQQMIGFIQHKHAAVEFVRSLKHRAIQRNRKQQIQEKRDTRVADLESENARLRAVIAAFETPVDPTKKEPATVSKRCLIVCRGCDGAGFLIEGEPPYERKMTCADCKGLRYV